MRAIQLTLIFMKWCAKIAAKIILARLPIPYRLWNRLGLFVHGEMNHAGYAHRVFKLHQSRAFPNGLPRDFTALELGPGDSLASALVARTYGASKIWLVDAGRFAKDDLATYHAIVADLRQAGLNPPDISGARSIDDILRICHATYLTDGLQSLRQLPAGCVDLIWSHAVLEHLRRHEFSAIMSELQRVSAPQSVSSHNIDFQDHLENSLHNLRLPARIWESPLFQKSGFYTNRIRGPQMVQMMKEAGFTICAEDAGRWPSLPVPRAKLDPEFRDLSDDALLIRTMHIVMTPTQSAEKAA